MSRRAPVEIWKMEAKQALVHQLVFSPMAFACFRLLLDRFPCPVIGGISLKRRNIIDGTEIVVDLC